MNQIMEAAAALWIHPHQQQRWRWWQGIESQILKAAATLWWLRLAAAEGSSNGANHQISSSGRRPQQ
jgi:hypothetical protein